jgi:hypothetical protein
MSFHKGLTLERWRSFSFGDQILMVANEIHRACKALEKGYLDSTREACLRALDLFDLTTSAIEVPLPGRLRELRRWRELMSEQAVHLRPDLGTVSALLKVLLLFSPKSAAQIPELTLPS